MGSHEALRSVVFDWAPACEVALVLIENEDGGDQWLVSSGFSDDSPTPSEANKIKPSVTYGVAPAGISGLETTQPEPLIAGRRYNLVLWRLMPPNGAASCAIHFDDYCMIGTKSFTRSVGKNALHDHREFPGRRSSSCVSPVQREREARYPLRTLS